MRNGTEELVCAHLDLVKRVASRLRRTLPHGVPLEDLTGAGMLGLLDAARRFDPRKSVPFGLYAAHRIRGAILDSLRAVDPLSKDLRRKHREAERAIAALLQKLGRPPTEEEIAARLNLTMTSWLRLSRQLYEAGCPVNGFGSRDKRRTDAENVPASDGNPELSAARQELWRMLDEAMRTLPARHQQVLRLYYMSGWTMQQIGRKLGVNESRVSQIHTAAIRRMRAYLEADPTA